MRRREGLLFPIKHFDKTGNKSKHISETVPMEIQFRFQVCMTVSAILFSYDNSLSPIYTSGWEDTDESTVERLNTCT